MNIYFYSGQESAPARQLCRYLQQIDRNGRKPRICRLSTLEPGTDSPLRIGDILILLANNSEELDLLVSRKEVFADYRLIVILPDSSPESITKMHLLRPRFFEIIDNDWTRINAVVSNFCSRDSSHQPRSADVYHACQGGGR